MILSNQARGELYRRQTLDLLGRLGYGSARQVAKAVWGELTPSTRKMASRLLTRLLDAGWLVARRDGDVVNGERLYALTLAGARQLEYTLPKNRPHARDWLRHAHSHRTAANSVFVAGAPCAGSRWSLTHATELEIRSGSAPDPIATFEFTIDGEPHGKIPDVVFGESANRVWVEVENTWRSTKDLAKLVAFLRALFWHGAREFAQVWLVVTSAGAKTIGERLRKALTHDNPRDGWPRQIKELDVEILARYVKVLVLDHQTLTLHPESAVDRFIIPTLNNIY